MNNKAHLAKIVKQITEKTTLKVYSSFAIALSEYFEDLTPEEIMEIFELSEAIWQTVADKNVDIFAWCKDVSGVDLKQFLEKG